MKEVDRMSRRNFRKNLVALLACSALILATLGCESVTGPDSTPDNSLSTGASYQKIDNPNG